MTTPPPPPPTPSVPSPSSWALPLLLAPPPPPPGPSPSPPPGPSLMHRERAVEAKVTLPIPDSCLVRVPPHGGSFYKCVCVCVCACMCACVYNFVNWECVSTLCIDIIYTIFHVSVYMGVCVPSFIFGCQWSSLALYILPLQMPISWCPVM